MTAVARPEPAFWTVQRFRDFIETRADEERWELIDGVPIMITPPTFIHNCLASNLESLLNDALRLHRRDLIAFRRMGLDLFPDKDAYQPEPDVSVVDAGIDFNDRYARRFYSRPRSCPAATDADPGMRKRHASTSSALCTAITPSASPWSWWSRAACWSGWIDGRMRAGQPRA